jgi:hypothetical protein
MDVILLLAVAVACYVGFASLALSQDRHWHLVEGGRHCPPFLVVPLRAGGLAFLLLALVLALLRDGASFGSLLWATMISVTALAVVATLAWRARWLRPLARLCRPAGFRSG